MATDLPYFPLYVKDFAADSKVEAMSTEEVGAYILLLCKAWHERPPGSLPADDAVLARWARLTPQRWSECKPRVLSCFEQRSDGRWHQKRMASEFLRLMDQRSKRSMAGKKGAKNKWTKDGNANGNANDFANGTHMADGSGSGSGSSEVGKGGAGEGAKAREPPNSELTPEWLSRVWCSQLKRRNAFRLPQDTEHQAAEAFRELIRLGVRAEVILAEIEDTARDRFEWLSTFRDRLKRNANVNGFRRESTAQKIARINAEMKAVGAPLGRGKDGFRGE